MKTTKYLIAIIAGIAIFAAVASVSAQTDDTKLVLPEFSSIVISSPIEIKLIQGAENSVSIKEGNINDKLTTEVKDNILYIKGKPMDDVTLTFTKLSRIELLSNCEVISEGQVSSDKLEVIMRGAASEINLNLNVKQLNTVIEGAADVTYKGTADAHSIEIKGAGDINAYDLVTISTNIEISGAGDAKVNVSQDLKGTINGAGDIKYLNEPATRDIKVNGIGSYGMKGSEESDNDCDTIKFKFGHNKVFIVGDNKEKDSADHKSHKKHFKTYWAGVGLGVNGYMNANNETTLPAGYDFLDLNYRKSINVAVNFWEQKIPIWKNHVNIVTGMGMDISNYRFNNNYRLLPDSDYVSSVYDSSVTFDKNKLTATYLNVPLLLQFDTKAFGKEKRTLHISGGVVGGVRLYSHTKQIFEIDGDEFTSKTKDDFNLNPFRYSSMVRIGYGNLDLYASYSLNGLFKENEGPQLYPFTVGITLVGF